MFQGMLWNNKILSCLVEKHGMVSEWNGFIDVLLLRPPFFFFWWKMHFHSHTFWINIVICLVQPCTNPDCLYLHEIGSQEDSYTKDEIISAYTRYLHVVIHPNVNLSFFFVCVHIVVVSQSICFSAQIPVDNSISLGFRAFN